MRNKVNVIGMVVAMDKEITPFMATAGKCFLEEKKGPFLVLGYELYGKKSLTGATPPPPDTPVGSDMSYFLREGSHDLLLSDWECYMDAFERALK